jgi:hypothetical protein
MSADFRRHLRRMQTAFSQSITNEGRIGFWLYGIGERLQLILPGRGLLPFGQSDAIIAHLLAGLIPGAQIIGGWLFSQMIGKNGLPVGQKESGIHQYSGCVLPTSLIRSICLNESRRQQRSAAPLPILAVDGRGAIVICDEASSPIACPDSLLALAFLLSALSKTPPADLQKLIPANSLGYRLLPCPDEAKAYLMRRLVEAYDQFDLQFSDGVRLKGKNQTGNAPASDWVVVRPCAGKEALEIFWCENGGSPSLSVSVRRRLALWLRQ